MRHNGIDLTESYLALALRMMVLGQYVNDERMIGSCCSEAVRRMAAGRHDSVEDLDYAEPRLIALLHSVWTDPAAFPEISVEASSPP